MHPITTMCPRCGGAITGPFPTHCPYCPFTLDPLIGRGTTAYQKQQWDKHTDILQGRDIRLGDGPGGYNASFDFNGSASLIDIVRYTLIWGERVSLPKPGRPHPTEYIVAYLREPLGAGTAIRFPGTVACSGIALVSPKSSDWGHPHPYIDEWLQQTFSGRTSLCRLCHTPTPFGVTICDACYAQNGSHWINLI